MVGEIEKTAIEEFQGVEYSGYGIGTRHLVTHGITADFALLAEPTGMRISIANMGCIWLRISVGGTVAHSAMANRPNVVNAIAVMHELQHDSRSGPSEYEASHVFMGEHPNVTFAAIRGGAPWRLSRNPYECSLYLDIRTVPGQTVDSVKRELRRVLRRFGERKGIPEPKLHNLRHRSAGRCSTKTCRSSRRSARRSRTSPASDRRRSSGGPAPMRCISPPMACLAWLFRPGRAHASRRAQCIVDACVGEHVLVEDCVAAAKIYLAMALDLCSRKAVAS